MVSAYLTTLILVIPILLLHSKMDKTRDKKKQFYFDALIVGYIILIFTLVTGFRDTASITYNLLGPNDEYRYRLAFDLLIGTPFSLSNINSFEWARYILDWTLANVFKNSQVWVFTYALLTNILFVKAINKYVKPLWFGIYLYITLGLFTFQMNGTTQMFAAAILTLSIKYIIEKKFWRFSIIVLIAAGFHFSAWIMLPLYFILTKRSFSKSTLMGIFVAIVLMIELDTVVKFILLNTPYDIYINRINSDQNYGVNIFRVLIFTSIFIFILISKSKIRDISIKDYYFINNIYILLITTIVSIASVFVSRLDIYFQFAIIYMLPKVIIQFRVNIRYIIVLIVVIAFFIFGLQQNWNYLYENILLL